MTWDLVYEEINRLSSYLNKKRTRYIVNKLKRFSDDDLTPALYMEFMSMMTKEEVMSPLILARTGRYIRQNKALTAGFGLPVFVGGYIIFENYRDRKLVWNALKAMEAKTVQAYLALMVSGHPYYKSAIRVKVKMYNPETGEIENWLKVTPSAKKYLDEQYNRAISDGLLPDDPLFYIKSKGRPVRRITRKDINRANMKEIANSGVDIFKYSLLSYRMMTYAPGSPVRVHREKEKHDQG